MIWGVLNTHQLIVHLPLFQLSFPANARYLNQLCEIYLNIGKLNLDNTNNTNNNNNNASNKNNKNKQELLDSC